MQSLANKDRLLPTIAQKMVIFKQKLSDKVLLNGLRRRLKQNRSRSVSPFTPSEDISCRCMNSSSLTWNEVVESLLERENLGNETAGPLSLSQLKEAASLMESELALLANDLIDVFHIDKQTRIQDQFLLHFPVMSVEKDNIVIFINLHELILQPSTFTSLFELFGSSSSKDKSSSIPSQASSMHAFK